jgi:hypothetical protein
MSVDVPLAVFMAICEHREKTGCKQEIFEMAGAAITDWLAAQQSPTLTGSTARTGYQWKDAFLPDGTVLRTVFGGRNYHAVVEGDALLYNGKPTSPSAFVNAVGCGARNAWTTIWVLRPGKGGWCRAADLRRSVPRRRRQAP